MKKKLTPWFPADVKPVHVGVYQRGEKTQTKGFLYWYWNGQHWETGGWQRAESAVLNPRGQSLCDYLCWRGLAEKPN